MDPILESKLLMNRRFFMGRTASGLGAAALTSLLNGKAHAEAQSPGDVPHFPAKAKRVIYMFQSGAPSQMDLFDPKPMMDAQFDKDLPAEIRKGQRLTTMTSGQKRFPIAPSIYDFKQHGQSGATVSNLLPHIAAASDDICYVKSMYTEAINHDPAMTFFQSGFQLAGRIGSAISKGRSVTSRP